MAVKYLAIDSAGVGFDVDETRTVEVTNEALTVPSGFEGDVVTYTATVKDNTGAALPDTFYAELMLDGVLLVSGTFGPGIYDPITFVLTAPFIVPTVTGSFIVKLTSVDQII
jgi:hypothetical protein